MNTALIYMSLPYQVEGFARDDSNSNESKWVVDNLIIISYVL